MQNFNTNILAKKKKKEKVKHHEKKSLLKWVFIEFDLQQVKKCPHFSGKPHNMYKLDLYYTFSLRNFQHISKKKKTGIKLSHGAIWLEMYCGAKCAKYAGIQGKRCLSPQK